MNFDTNKYKVWTWKHPVMLHWILNPGLAINELVFGQRVPKVSLVERNNNKPLAERSFIPCPHCNTIHPGLKWTPQNKTAFGNWFGLYCDNCAGIIPCLRNLTSAILLAITFPFWIWFIKSWKKKWLETQKQKFSKPLQLSTPVYNWVTQGLSFGFYMFVLMNLVLPLIDGEGYLLLKLAVGVLVWTLGGLLFGYVTKKLIFQPRKNSQDKTQQVTE